MTPPDRPDRDRFSRVADHFHRALDLSPAERAAFLDQLKKAEPDVGNDVAALVVAHGRAESFIERPAFDSAHVAPPHRPIEVPKDPIGHYRVLEVIGEGGMGVVYLAEDTRLGRTVALKAVRTGVGDVGSRTERLRREARAAALLTHPNIATVFALEEIDGQLYIASEYVPGRTLRDEMNDGPLPAARIRQIGLAMARALAAAHERGIIHRDLKPENVITTSRGDVKVLDFGLAQFTDPAAPDAVKTAEGAVLGTPAYMSPEQIRGGTVDGRSDLFALGVTLYELITGQHPFASRTPAATIARVLEERPAVSAVLSDLQRADPNVAAVADVITRCLEKAPASRPQSAADVIAMLEAASPATVPISPGPAGTWWWQFHQGATTMAYLLLLIPLWRTRSMAADLATADAHSAGAALFFAGLVAAVVAGTLRLHLWFALRQYPGEWANEHHVARRLVRAADVVFALVLAARGFTAIRIDDPSAALLIASAAAVAVSFAVIEPATTKAMKEIGGNRGIGVSG